MSGTSQHTVVDNIDSDDDNIESEDESLKSGDESDSTESDSDDSSSSCRGEDLGMQQTETSPYFLLFPS